MEIIDDSLPVVHYAYYIIKNYEKKIVTKIRRILDVKLIKKQGVLKKGLLLFEKGK